MRSSSSRSTVSPNSASSSVSSSSSSSNATVTTVATSGPVTTTGGKEAAFFFNPFGDLLQAFQSAMTFGRKSRPKESPIRKRTGPNTITNSDTLHFEHIELAQLSRIELDPTQTGIGHSFSPTPLLNPTWCDLCGDGIWSLYQSRDSLKCHNCNYTCHDRCHGLVTLNCKTQTTDLQGTEFFEVKCEEPESLLFTDQLQGAELKAKIESYNCNAGEGYEMEMQEDGETFHGFIRVHMNLSRPINVLAGCRPPSIYDIMYEEDDIAEKTLTSFYLPHDTVKALHVTSRTTTQELISVLLRKFKVVDNPRKYCLYEKYWEGEGSVKGILRRMQNCEKPLWLVLSWGMADGMNRKLVLQENDTGDIMWEAFTLPELSNFLRILDREEEEYLNQVRLKYKKMETKLRRAIKSYENSESYEDVIEEDDDDEGGFLSARPSLAFYNASQ